MGVIIPQVVTEDRASGALVVDGSLQLSNPKNQYLSRTPSSAGNLRTWTLSFWHKTDGNTSISNKTFAAQSGSSIHYLEFASQKIDVGYYTGSHSFNVVTTQVFRDPSAWYHIVLVFDTNNGTSTDRVRIFVNGSRVTDFSTSNFPTSGFDGLINSTNAHAVGGATPGTYFATMSAKLSQVYLIDGQALDASYFGYTDPLTNTWRPKKLSSSVAFGTNGFYLPLDGNTPIGQDQSGRGNNWTPVNFGGSNTLEKATGAFPILNTDGGGKVARVGVRTDSYYTNLKLAVPFVGVATDVVQQINGNSASMTSFTANNATFAVHPTAGAPYGTGLYLNSVSDYPNINYAAGTFNFLHNQTGSGTVEFWMYNGAYTDEAAPLGNLAGSPDVGFSIIMASSTTLQAVISRGVTGSSRTSGTASIPQNTWSHIAATKTINGSNAELKLYVNGVLSASNTSITASDLSNSNSTYSYFRIGQNIGDETARGWTNYYMNDLRIYDTVKYTQNFIPASTDPDILPDTPSGVAYSSNVTAITEGAVAFDGSGDYLELAYNADLDFTGEFTLEGFVYPNVSTGDHSVFGNFLANATGNWGLAFDYSTYGVFTVFYYQGNTSVQNNGYVPIPRAWNHYAVTRDASNIIRVFLNGQLLPTTATYSGTLGVNAQSSFIGWRGGLNPLNGVLSNVNWVKGTCLYTSNFTPPTAPLTAVANTKLLCCKSNSSAGAATSSPNLGGVNNGTVWSDYMSTTGTLQVANSFPLAFDGSTSTNVRMNTGNGTMTYSGPSFTVSSQLRMYLYQGNGGTGSVSVNGVDQGVSFATEQWYTIGSFTGTVNTFTITASANQGTQLYAVEVDGVILKDPITRNGNAAATNFNPFTANINAVRGQETGYCTLNPLDLADFTLSNGNLNYSKTSTTWKSVRATQGVNSGKWYYEFQFGSDNRHYIGISQSSMAIANYPGATSTSYSIYLYNGYKSNNGSDSAYASAFASTDVLGVAFDLDASTITFYKNGISLGVAFTSIASGYYFPTFGTYLSGENGYVNFGQKPFKFPPPAGFQPLNAANVRPSTVVARPDQYVGIVTYSGLGNSGMKVSGYNFKPDLIWIKARNQTYNNILYDSVRGTGSTKAIFSDDTVAEGSYSQYVNLASFDRDGFTVGSTGANNNAMSSSAANFVAWCWKAGGNSNTYNINDVGYATASAAGLTAGTITPTGASVGTKQGFSIIKYTGTNSNDSVPHGLLQAPNFVIIKDLDDTQPWVVGHTSIGFTKYLWLNSQNGEASLSTVWQDTAPTSSVFTIGATAGVNASGDNYIAYLWHDVPGLQKFGSFIGNLSTDGPFVELGFRAKFIIYKVNQNSHNWMMFDSERDKYNICSASLRGNLSNIESSFSALDICSNGFKFRNTDTNPSGAQIIYAAFAEAPSFNLYGAQANAR